MAVDDVAVRTFQAEFLQDEVADFGVLIQRVVRVLGFGPRSLIRNQAAFKGRHAVAAEDGAVAAGPQEPQKIHPEFALGRAALVVVSLACGGIDVVQQVLAGAGRFIQSKRKKLPLRGERDTAVEQQVAVVDFIDAAFGVEEADVPLQLLAALEGIGQLVNDGVLFGGEVIGVFRIHGREVGVLQRPGDAVDGDAFVFVVDLVQQQPVFHAVFRVTEDLLTLQLEENDRDGLMHAGGKQLVLFGVMRGVGAGELYGEAADVAVTVGFVGKHRERPQGNAVTGFDHFEVVVVDGV